jgi:uncharacterized protein YhaN
MRLHRLDLTRYGKFTDKTIDFGDLRAGAPDLHIIYGPNEAGKSTTLAAFLDLLFGIEQKTTYKFQHEYAAMRIGATLEWSGHRHELIRVKKDLLDREGRPVGELLLRSQLGGIDRPATYSAMFSLDDDTLEKGGEAILQSKGDLGQLLFTASAGLAGLGQTLTELRATADAFHKPRAHDTELRALKKRLDALKDERQRIDTAASKFADLSRQRARAREQYEQASAARNKTQTRIAELNRQIIALPRLADLRQARTDLQPLAALPTAPPEWAAEVRELIKEETTIGVNSVKAMERIADLEKEIAGIAVDDKALDMADRFARLDASRAQNAEQDIPDRRQELNQANLDIATSLGRIGRPSEADPRRLLIDAATTAMLHDLIESAAQIAKAKDIATGERTRAAQAVQAAQQRLSSSPAEPQPDAFSHLAACVSSLRNTDHPHRRRTAERDHTKHADDLAARLRALHPWHGDANQLAALPLPDASTVQSWKAALAEAQNRLDLCSNKAEQGAETLHRLTSERAAIAVAEGVLSDRDAAERRAAREAAWGVHRRALSPDTADSFEAAMRADDLIISARLTHAAAVASLNQLTKDIALAEANLKRDEQALVIARAQRDAVRAEIDRAVAPALPAGTPIADIESWLERRRQALETHATLRQAEHNLNDAVTRAETARQRLTDALQAANISTAATVSFEELQAAAEAALEHHRTSQQIRAAIAAADSDLAAREAALNKVALEEQAWQISWTTTCAGTWLAELGATPPIPAVRAILLALPDLAAALSNRAGLISRIDQMIAAQAAYAEQIADIASELGMSTNPTAALETARAIKQRITEARDARTNHARITQDLLKARDDTRKLAEFSDIHERRKTALTTHFNVETLDDVAVKLHQIDRKTDLEKQIAAATRDILEALGLPDIAAAETLLDTVQRPALDAELATLKHQLADEEQLTRELYHTQKKLEADIDSIGGDDAVARIEEQRQTVLLDIEERARETLKLRLGIVAAEYALRAYRKQHQSSMMAAASDAFHTISRHAYRGLASQPERDNEVLIAIAADGSSKIASALSKGTRFQLYLALRVAGYREYARMHPPVPFIADDIMETFDDFRAEEAIRLLADMASVGQVIYLTHHRHICAIAKETLPGVQIIEL